MFNHSFAKRGLEKFPELVDSGSKPFIGRVPLVTTTDGWELSEDFREHFENSFSPFSVYMVYWFIYDLK